MKQQRAQDPDERFDLVTADGRPLGRSKRRADVHRDGDWHRAIHVWLLGIDAGTPFVLLQLRGRDKDTWPGRLDATAAGHLATGETAEGAFREIEEELGIVPDLAALRHVGTRIHVSEQPGWIDRELQEIYLLRDDRPLAAYRPDPAEVNAIIRISLPAWTELLFGDRATVDAEHLDATTGAIRTTAIGRDDHIPVIDGYFRRVAVACQRLLAGDRHIIA